MAERESRQLEPCNVVGRGSIATRCIAAIASAAAKQGDVIAGAVAAAFAAISRVASETSGRSAAVAATAAEQPAPADTPNTAVSGPDGNGCRFDGYRDKAKQVVDRVDICSAVCRSRSANSAFAAEEGAGAAVAPTAACANEAADACTAGAAAAAKQCAAASSAAFAADPPTRSTCTGDGY
ncbi:hypothetical protein [Mycolicibacterium agri]|uniref:Uncharacterized protein n=1 Tax=Mycolicibacterium agri TaxID=36811 RepID=A0A7I9W162_MYCAG|nr:hypothetical protein [Mycolicibacterium agri]GFG51037.1 hypothetical protein MAGR_24780 [Mycolicibacterium agri]